MQDLIQLRHAAVLEIDNDEAESVAFSNDASAEEIDGSDRGLVSGRIISDSFRGDGACGFRRR